MKNFILIVFALCLTGVAWGQEIKIKEKRFEELRNAEKENKNLKNEIQALKKKTKTIPDKDKRIQALEKQVEELQKASKTVITKAKEIKKLKEEAATFKGKLAAKEKEMKLLNAKAKKLKEENSKIAAKDTEINRLKDEKVALETEIKQLREDNREVAVTKTANKIMKEENIKLKKLLETKTTENKKQTATIKQLKSEKTKLEQKYKKLHENLKISFIPAVRQYTKSLAYDLKKTARLKSRCLSLQAIFPEQKAALSQLTGDLKKYKHLSTVVEQYKAVLAKPYERSGSLSVLKIPQPTTFSSIQNKDITAHQQAIKEYCVKSGITYNSVRGARAHIRDNALKMRSKLKVAFARLDPKYTYLRQEVNKNIRNLNYQCRITKSACRQ